jgi:hypothetical protein
MCVAQPDVTIATSFAVDATPQGSVSAQGLVVPEHVPNSAVLSIQVRA